MTNTFAIKLKLTFIRDEDRYILDGQSRKTNKLYNLLLEKANNIIQTVKETGDKSLLKMVYSKRGLRDLVPHFKKLHPYLATVYAAPLKNAAFRLQSAIKVHKENKKKGQRYGWPKFNSWKRNWFSLLYDEPYKGYKIYDHYLDISLGLGQDRKQKSLVMKLDEVHRLKDVPVKTMRIIYESGAYYAIFTVAEVSLDHKPIRTIAAMDPNHKNFGYVVSTTGNATEILSPRWLKNIDKQIDEVKSKRDMCKKKSKKMDVLTDGGKPTGEFYWQPSRRWNHYNETLQYLYTKRREMSKTYLYTIAHKVFKEYDCFGIGNYAPQGNGITTAMRRSMNNQSLIGKFKHIAVWVAQKSKKICLIYDEKGTTRTCSTCGYSFPNGLAPSIREWACPACNTYHLRDENSAINGLRKVSNLLKEKGEVSSLVSGSDLVIKKRSAWRVMFSGIKTLRKPDRELSFTTPRNLIKGMVPLAS